MSNIEAVNLTAILVDFQYRPFNRYRRNGEVENCADDLDDEVDNSNTSEDISQEEENVIVTKEVQPAINLLVNVKDKGRNTFSGKTKYIVVGFAVVLFLGLIIKFTVFPKQQCMQWSQDHYELVDCDSKAQGFATLNTIEPLDPNLINLKKITLSDTTVCFDKNGNGIIWYAKTDKGVDYFNTHGRHPENGKSLRPVTKYILEKYKK